MIGDEQPNVEIAGYIRGIPFAELTNVEEVAADIDDTSNRREEVDVVHLHRIGECKFA